LVFLFLQNSWVQFVGFSVLHVKTQTGCFCNSWVQFLGFQFSNWRHKLGPKRVRCLRKAAASALRRREQDQAQTERHTQTHIARGRDF
jgi:hypothetical protein